MNDPARGLCCSPRRRPVAAPPGVEPLEARIVFNVAPPFIAVGSEKGQAPLLRLFDAATGEQTLEITPYPSQFDGGVRVALADFNADLVPDIVTAPGKGDGSQVRVFDGRTGTPLSGFLGGFDAYEPSYHKGVNVAAADVNGDSIPDILTGTDDGVARVKVFSGADGSVLHDFTIDDYGQHGVRVAAVDLPGIGGFHAAIVTAPAQGGEPRIHVYDGATAQESSGPLGSFLAFESNHHGGVSVAAGDVNGDGTLDVIAGTFKHDSRVRIFSGADGSVLADFDAFESSFDGGIRVAAAYLDGDERADIVVGSGKDDDPRVWSFSGATFEQLTGPAGDIPVEDPFNRKGVFVAAGHGQGPALSVTGTSFVATLDLLFTGPVVSFTDLDGLQAPEQYEAIIDWGDGSTSPGIIGGPNMIGKLNKNSTNVSGAHTYAALGWYTITVTIKERFGAKGQATSSAWVVTEDSPYGTTTNCPPDIPPMAECPPDWPCDCPCPPELIGNGAGSGGGGIGGGGGGWGPGGPTIGPGGPGKGRGGSGLPELQLSNVPVSAGPVRYADGTMRIQFRDVEVPGFGDTWGLTRSWTNHSAYTDSTYAGSGSVIHQFPYLHTDAIDIYVISSGVNARRFENGSEQQFYLQETLVYDEQAEEYVFTDTMGQQIRFTDGLEGRPYGLFESWTDAAGNVTAVVSRTEGGAPTEVQRSVTTASVTTTDSMLYTYVAEGVNAGQFETVTWRRQIGSSGWSTLRSVEYTYYDGEEAHGNALDLKTATIKDGASNVLETKYYRYYTAAEANGYQHGLKFVFNAEAFARLDAAVSDPITATDTEVAPYADFYFEYDVVRRVTKEVVSAAGCSACSGGQGTFLFSYGLSTLGGTINLWVRKTIETLPDGNQNIVYMNDFGQELLRVYRDTSTEQEWATFTQYDEDGRVVFVASPSAVSGYDEEYGDLLHFDEGNFEYLRDDAGLIQTFTYYTETTAGETTAGGAAGYFESVSLQRGELGTPVLQSTAEYFAHEGGDTTIYPVATSTVYRNDDGTGAQTTSYSYTWFTDSAQRASVTVSLPVVGSTQNGPGSADTATTVFDDLGRPIWTKDGDGFLTFTEYDRISGAVTKFISDVDTTQTSDFSALPSGWSTPSGGGLHLEELFEVDGLGRTTKYTDPNGAITYTVYNDEDHEVRVYPGWNSSTNAPTGPTQVVREDRAGNYVETLTMTATPSLTSGRPNGTEAISGVQTLSREYANAAGQYVTRDDYFNLSGLTYSTSTTLGTVNTHFYRTEVQYGSNGEFKRELSPTGTITRYVTDGQRRLVSIWVGTDDTPTTGFWSPTNTAGTNLVKVADYEYDGGGIGDGNLTKETLYPGGSAAARVTQHFYDWRNREVATKQGVETSEATSVNRQIFYFVLDNLGQVTSQRQYDGDGVSITSSSGVPQAPSASLLRARTDFLFDDQGRVYRTQQFSVDQDDGDVSTNSLKTDVWFDHRGQVIKTSAPGGLVMKLQYDGAGRVSKMFTTDGGSDSAWSDADDVTSDIVLSQSENTYDAAGNVLLVTLRDRFHDETATGALGNATTAPKARVSYVASYYDAINRLTASVNVGTNGGSSYTRPSSVPSRSDTVLVHDYAFNAAGWLEAVTDPKGVVAKTFYDNLARVTKTIENYINGNPTSNDDITTEYTYNGINQMLTLKAVLPTSYQTTEWVYGVSGSNNDITSNDILGAVKYPDPSTGNPSTSEQETYTVSALGERKTRTDRNGSVHTYARDVLGRLTADAVTTLASGVDGDVRRLEFGFDTAGRPSLFTSYDAASGGNIVNQVQRVFNGLGQLITEYQSHSGAVNTSTTPKVQYAYSEMASGANHSRLTSITYPNGRVLNYNYASGIDASISRLTSLSDSSATLEELTYLGLGTVVRRAHPEPDIDLTYIKLSTESTGDAGDQYTGLDRFGRVVDQRWLDTGTNAATDRFQYGYDRNGNRLYRENLVDAAFSELYAYDSLNQLTRFDRGTLNSNKDGISGTAARTQEWNLDALGNWNTLTTNGTDQDRTHDLQNQITSIEGQTTPAYDNNGNMTTDQQGNTLIYNAWNWLVEVKDGSTTLVAYGQDALGRRVTEDRSSTVTDLYYSAKWQVLEERVSGSATVQYVWSPVYIDALVLRDRDANSSSGDGLEERLYVQQDANFNVTALVDASGDVVERNAYDPFGALSVLTPAWGTRGSTAYAWVYYHQGGRFDAGVLLYSFRKRDYSSHLGRWLQRDPIEFGGGDTNLYRAVQNNPASRNDPTGLTPAILVLPFALTLEEVLVILGLVGGVGAGAVLTDGGRCMPRLPDLSLPPYIGAGVPPGLGGVPPLEIPGGIGEELPPVIIIRPRFPDSLIPRPRTDPLTEDLLRALRMLHSTRGDDCEGELPGWNDIGGLKHRMRLKKNIRNTLDEMKGEDPRTPYWWQLLERLQELYAELRQLNR